MAIKYKKQKLIEFIIALAAGLFISISIQSYLSSTVSSRFLSEVELIKASVKDKELRYQNLIKNIGSSVDTLGPVSRVSWQKLYGELELQSRYQSISSIFYVKSVFGKDLISILNNIKNDTSISSEGFPQVKIPEESSINPQEKYFVIDFIEPLTDNRSNAIGSIIGGQTKNLLLNATEFKIFSTPITYSVTTDQPVFTMYYPLKSNDLGSVDKFVAFAFRAPKFFSTIVDESLLNSLKIEFNTKVLNSTDYLFSIGDDITGANLLKSDFENNFFDTTFNVSVSAKGDYSLTDLDKVSPFLRGVGIFIVTIFLLQTIAGFFRSRENALEKAKEADSKFQTIFNNMFSFIGILTPDGILIDANKTAIDFVGVPKSRLINKYFWDTDWWLNSDQNREMLKESIKKAAKGELVRYVVFVQGKDSIIPIDFSIKPVYDAKGNVEFLIPEGRNIEDSIKYEERLKIFKEAVENVNSHIIFTDADGKIIYCNNSVSRITGYTREEIIGSTAALWGKQMPIEFYKDMWHKIKDLKLTFRGEIKNKRKNGEVYDARVIITPILDDQRNVKFFVGLEEDISREKAIERDKNDFISITSHQLRTPLTGIKWFIELLSEDKSNLTKDQLDFVNQINKSNNRMLELINDLLDVSRIENKSKKFTIDKTLINVKDLVKESVNALTDTANTDGIKFSLNLDDFNANVDVNKFRDVTDNIIENAIKYSRANSEIKVELKKKPYNRFMFSVEDHGIGIPETEKSKIFIKFFRSSNALTESPSGTGLGLYFAKSIVEMHGGTIDFRSEEGKGTTFYVYMPIE